MAHRVASEPSSTPAGELARLRRLLAPIEAEAAMLPWAGRDPWRVTTHVGHDGVLAAIDLHGLSAQIARRVVGMVADAPPEIGLVWIHGRGGRMGKPPGVLVHVVREVLGPRLAERGWRIDAHGPRTVWITDPSRASGAGTSWLLVALGIMLAIGAVLIATRPWWDR